MHRYGVKNGGRYVLQAGWPVEMSAHYGPSVPTHVDAADLLHADMKLYFLKSGVAYEYAVSGAFPTPTYTLQTQFSLVEPASPFSCAGGGLVPSDIRTWYVAPGGGSVWAVAGVRGLWEYSRDTGTWTSHGELTWLV